MIIKKEELESIIFDKNYDSYYPMRVELSEEILIHSRGDISLIRDLIKGRFPSEPSYVSDYRLRNISKITKTYFNKIVSTLAKIDKAEDFRILYKDKLVKQFCENEIPQYRSVRRWFFTVGLKALLSEPNGLVVCIPNDPEFPNEPTIRIIPAHDVIYQQPEYVIINIESGKRYLYLDDQEISIIEIKEGKGKQKTYSVSILLEHNLGKKPYFVLGGNQVYTDEYSPFESFVSGIVPFFNQALIEFSDKQAGIKQHVYPEKWRLKTNSCPTCGGKGHSFFTGKDGRDIKSSCNTCGGTGDAPTGMFSEVVIEQGDLLTGGDKPIIPPMGYVEKSFAAIEYLDADIRRNIYSGLAALNMEFLAENPANESGLAKEMDRQELNAFIYQIASYSTENILIPLHEILVDWLYYGQNYDPKISLPDITTPVHFDFTSANDFDKRLESARNSGVSPYILNQLERKYIEKRFENFDEERTLLLQINDLDPVPSRTVDEKIKLYKQKLITYEDFVCSSNIETLMKQILWDRVWFPTFPYEKRVSILKEYTNKLINTLDESETEDVQSTESDDDVGIPDNGGGIEDVEILT